jgi:anti-anti-sigma factor
MVQTSVDWQLDVARGPGCVIVRPHHLDKQPLRGTTAKNAATRHAATMDTAAAEVEEVTLSEVASLAEDIWAILDKHLTYRVVLDMDDVTQLTSGVLGQLVALQARVDAHGGMVRVCGLSPSNENVLDVTQLRSHIPCYSTRGEAVHGSIQRPVQPR